MLQYDHFMAHCAWLWFGVSIIIRLCQCLRFVSVTRKQADPRHLQVDYGISRSSCYFETLPGLIRSWFCFINPVLVTWILFLSPNSCSCHKYTVSVYVSVLLYNIQQYSLMSVFLYIVQWIIQMYCSVYTAVQWCDRSCCNWRNKYPVNNWSHE